MLLLAAACYGVEPTPTFEVASVKPATPPPGRPWMTNMRGGPGTNDPGRITYGNMPLKFIIMNAYDVKDYQFTGPEWLDNQRFDIQAKVPEGTTKEDAKVMMQNLLIERFHLKVRRESKEMKTDELVVAKSGPKLTETTLKPGGDGPPRPPGPPKMDANGNPQLDRPGMMTMFRMVNGAPSARMVARAQTMSSLANFLSFQVKHPVIDKTGLTGSYDFNLEFTPEGMGMMMMGPAPPGKDGINATPQAADPGTPLAGAIQQLGLRLESKKAAVDVLIVEQIDKLPTEN